MYQTPYLPCRPEPRDPWDLSHQAVWEADGIISDTPDFAPWANACEDVSQLAQGICAPLRLLTTQIAPDHIIYVRNGFMNLRSSLACTSSDIARWGLRSILKRQGRRASRPHRHED